MSHKKNVYFSDESHQIVKNRHSDRESGFVSFSAVTNEITQRYQWIMTAALPELSNDEWTAILNVYAGCIMSKRPTQPRIASDMMDNVGAEDFELLERNNPDYAALVKKIHELSLVEQLAVYDFVQQYWAGDWNAAEDFNHIADAIKYNVSLEQITQMRSKQNKAER